MGSVINTSSTPQIKINRDAILSNITSNNILKLCFIVLMLHLFDGDTPIHHSVQITNDTQTIKGTRRRKLHISSRANCFMSA